MQLKLIAGLGNSEGRYTGTYHNIGARFVNFLQKYPPFASLAEKIALLPTSGFMNESGSWILPAMTRLGAKPETTLLAHDDSDLTLGSYKLNHDRGAAGHNGVQSVFDGAHSNAFWRARIGIRSGTEKRQALEFVLLPIPSEELAIFETVFKKLADEIINNLTAHEQYIG